MLNHFLQQCCYIFDIIFDGFFITAAQTVVLAERQGRSVHNNINRDNMVSKT